MAKTKHIEYFPSSLQKSILWQRILIVFGSIGGINILLYSLSQTDSLLTFIKGLASGILISASAASIGIFVGFLFGIPRTSQQKARDKEPEGDEGSVSGYTVNTNLEEISDWLTKILIGVGLTQFIKLPSVVKQIVQYLAISFGVPQSEGSILLLTVYFSIGGFFTGYLITRMYLAVAFSYADIEVARLNSTKERIQSELESLDAELYPEGETGEPETRETAPPDPEKRKQITSLEQEIGRLKKAGVEVDAVTYRNLARQLRRIGKHHEAVSAYLNAFWLDQEHVSYLNSAAVIRSKHLDDFDGADYLYKHALSLKPDYITAKYNMACNEARRENYTLALQYLQEAISANKTRYIPLSQSDEAFVTLRDMDEFKALINESS